MSTAPRYQPHYTVEDSLHWEGRWALWEGARATVLVEIDWIVAHDTVVRSDITVVCGPAPEGHVEQTPGLVVEVLSPATRTRDCRKREVLERCSVTAESARCFSGHNEFFRQKCV